ncbi:MAG: hypothetical protein RL597_1278, partial [Pseudomonadota bacterium]
HDWAPVALQLEDVFTGVAVRCAKEKRETVVEYPAIGIVKLRQGGDSRRRQRYREHRLGDAACVGSGNSDDSDSAAPRSGGDGDNRVGCGVGPQPVLALFASASMRRLMFHCCAMVSNVLATQYSTRPAGKNANVMLITNGKIMKTFA